MRLAGILLLLFTLGGLVPTATADEYADSVRLNIPAGLGQPTEAEFVLAAKRTYFRRGLEYRVINGSTVEGVYNDPAQFRYEIRLEDSAVSIVWTGTDKKPKKVYTYLKRLERDLTYELGKYLL